MQYLNMDILASKYEKMKGEDAKSREQRAKRTGSST